MTTRTKKKKKMAKTSRPNARVLTEGELHETSGGAVYMKYGDIKGESTEDRHKDWIEVLSYSHNVK